MIEVLYIPNVFGGIKLVALAGRLNSVELGSGKGSDLPGPTVRDAERQVKQYLDGDRTQFELPLDFQSSGFYLRVWREIMKIPYGETRSYSEVVAAVNRPEAVGAIRIAKMKNRFPIIVPCHRVVDPDAQSRSVSASVDLDETLVTLEKLYAKQFRKI